MELWESFLDLLFPLKCPFCGRLLPDLREGLSRPGVCGVCAEDLPWTGERDGLPREAFSCTGPLWYQGKVRAALLRMKFHGDSAATGPLGFLLAWYAGERLSGAFNRVTYVPVSRERKRKRGFDQSALLARSACRYWSWRFHARIVPERLLVKTVDNRPQSGIQGGGAASTRRANVSGVYALAPGAAVRGRKILLLDDIRTTGATLREARRVLLEGGAASVDCAVVAFAPRRGESGGADGGVRRNMDGGPNGNRPDTNLSQKRSCIPP